MHLIIIIVKIIFLNTTISNTSSYTGGGLYSVGDSEITFENSNIVGNAATDKGGGVDIEHQFWWSYTLYTYISS